MKKTVLTMLVVGFVAVAAQAGTMHYSFDETAPGTWEVSIDVTGGDSAGMSAYAYWVSRNSGVSNVIDPGLGATLKVLYSEMYIPTPVTVASEFNCGSYQSTSHGVTGYGIGGPTVLGTLTTPIGLGVNDFRPDGGALFNIGADGYLSTGQTMITHEVNPIPEPASMSLVAFGGLALLRRRKK